MSENKKKSEIQNDLGTDLLKLVSEDEVNSGSRLIEANTALTTPEFDDKDAQNSWEKIAKAPQKTMVNPFFKEAIAEDIQDVNEINHQEKFVSKKQKNHSFTEVALNLEQNLKDSGPKVPFLKNKPALQEKLPISNIETIAITMLHRANNESDKPSFPQVPHLSVNNTTENLQNYKNKKRDLSEPQVIKSEIPPNVQNPLFDNQAKISEGKLGHIEQIRIAQNRISQLEKEVETLKWDNEKLGTAALILQKKCEELNSQKQKLEAKFENFEIKSAEENKILILKLDKKNEELNDFKTKFEDLDSRLAQDVRRSGGRERDLENRLELIKMEKISLVAGKDEIILNLKRQIDQFQFEVEGYRKKTSELQKTIEANDEQIRRTVRALRLALTNLEVSEESKSAKKAE